MSELDIKRVQNALIVNGYDIGPTKADGDFGPRSAAAALDAIRRAGPLSPKTPAPAANGPLPAVWLPVATMKRIIMHWTAGAYVASEVDKEHYHFGVEGDLDIFKGDFSIKDNEVIHGSNYAAHTRNCNTGSIGVTLCCMAGAKESPFDAGKYPMKREQLDMLIRIVAQLCHVYDIAVTRETVLSHAEVQPTLKITQAGKWDYTRLPFEPTIVGAIPVGDFIRSRVSAIL